ncbi:UPF0598 protein C8orf82 homolog [Lonchura striata]
MRTAPLLRLCARPGPSYRQGQRPEPGVREYFYYLDLHGRLFLDDAKVKNFSTCYRDVAFLSSFFGRLQPNRSGRFEARFPFVWRCGGERNFLRCADVPAVFTELLPAEAVPTEVAPIVGQPTKVAPNVGHPIEVAPNVGHPIEVAPNVGHPIEVAPTAGPPTEVAPNVGPPTEVAPIVGQPTEAVPTDPQPGARLALCGAGAALAVPFEPAALALLPESGRLYHPAPARLGGAGLLRSALAQELSASLAFGDGPEEPPTHLRWRGREIRLSRGGEVLAAVRAERARVEAARRREEEEGVLK